MMHKRLQMVRASNSHGTVIFRQKKLRIGSENSHHKEKGYGGQLFTIRFNDGFVVETTNLNDCGKCNLPNNAEFVRPKKSPF